MLLLTKLDYEERLQTYGRRRPSGFSHVMSNYGLLTRVNRGKRLKIECFVATVGKVGKFGQEDSKESFDPRGLNVQIQRYENIKNLEEERN